MSPHFLVEQNEDSRYMGGMSYSVSTLLAYYVAARFKRQWVTVNQVYELVNHPLWKWSKTNSNSTLRNTIQLSGAFETSMISDDRDDYRCVYRLTATALNVIKQVIYAFNVDPVLETLKELLSLPSIQEVTRKQTREVKLDTQTKRFSNRRPRLMPVETTVVLSEPSVPSVPAKMDSKYVLSKPSAINHLKKRYRRRVV